MMGYRLFQRTLPLLSVLRKRRFGIFLLLNFSQADCDSKEMSSNIGSESKNVSNGLLLYYNEYSFYSQKVVMALHEKRLNFESRIINITKGEQYSSWFLKLNPRGEVPVLQDTVKIIPDSGRIIDYLEDNFSNGDTPRLIPIEEGPEIRSRVLYFRTILEQLPMGIVTMGSFFHPDLVDQPKLPFIAPVRKLMANAERNSSQNLREYAQKNIEAKVVLSEKADVQDKKHAIITDRAEYEKVLEQIEEALIKVETDLTKNVGERENWWLCCETFTVADISLTILLERLNQLGLENRFWANGKRPHVAKFYERVKERDSYKKTIPDALHFAKTMVLSQGPVVFGFTALTTIALVVGGVFLAKRSIF